MHPTPILVDQTFVNVGMFAQGQEVLTHKHKRAGYFLIAHGTMRVSHFELSSIHTGPALVRLEADKNYKLECISPLAIVSCIHHLEPGETYPPIEEA